MRILSSCAVLLFALGAGPALAGTESPTWSAYLDYAYVYSSADSTALQARLEEYGSEAGISLQSYISEYFETLVPGESDALDESTLRRKAIAYLLDYLSRGAPASLDKSEALIRQLKGRLGRRENRYWYHYIRAHFALEKGYADDFVEEMLDLWVGAVVPLEGAYETLETLSLSDAPNSGFAAALPYMHENVARLLLLRSQEMGLDSHMDPLGALVRMLHDGRVGAHPDVIPRTASSRAYVERIAERLDGPESDGGSLTFTLALFEASKHHERVRTLLASAGLSPETLEAMRQASGAYQIALNQAATGQSQCSVYTRALRLLGEFYAAKQRLGVDPELGMPFSIEGAVQVYAQLHEALDAEWREFGYLNTTRAQYVDAMLRLWEEIQETSLNAADYYLTRSVESPEHADEHSRNAARVYARYLGFFQRFATDEGGRAVPDSAYFAAFEAAKGFGDTYLSYVPEPTTSEIERATQQYRAALALFPFDRKVWPALTAALSRHGRENEYRDLVQPIADWVGGSRAVNGWIEHDEPNAKQIAALRRAVSDSQVVMYLGFAEASSLVQFEADLVELVPQRDELQRELAELIRRRDALRDGAQVSPPASAASGIEEAATKPLVLAEMATGIADASARLSKLERKIEASSRVLPIYKEALATDGLTRELRTQRDHPVHTLLRRTYHESHSSLPVHGGPFE